ncbi:glycosyltransferase [Candidatus Micrarchaeota archaeon]|nr:glycosyltransferase [Candidatus Micrarchaeota archaeon]
MRSLLIFGSVFVLSLFAVGASLFWFLETGGLAAAVSLLIAIFSLFFNASGAQYITEAEKLRKGICPPKKKTGKIAVGIPVFEPDIERLEKCILSIKETDAPGELEITVLDDTPDKKRAGEIEALCRKKGVKLLHRKNPGGRKAGALNALLGKTDAEFLAVFDGDEIVRDDAFFRETMGHFERGRIAFVQTNKKCGGEGLFERAADYTNAAFVNLIQPINTRKGVGLFTGSCGIFRISALRDAGGFPHSLIEDVAVSLRLLWRGWKAEHIPKVYAEGAPVGRFSRFCSQHMRYISGVVSLLPEYARNIWGFSMEKKAIMVVHALGLHYVSLVQLAAAAIALLAALWGSQPGELASLAYLLSNLGALLILAKLYSGSFRVGLFAYLLNFSVALPRIVATLKTIFGSRNFGTCTIAFSALLQLLLGGVFLWVSIAGGSIASAWWGLLFLCNPALLLLRR